MTIVEYADFQCQFCGAAYPNLHELLRQRADTVRLVYRHFPIANVHPYAESAAEAAEAAGRRGRFWEMHDWLYEHQDQLDPVHLSLGVEQLGLPPDEIGAEVDAAGARRPGTPGLRRRDPQRGERHPDPVRQRGPARRRVRPARPARRGGRRRQRLTAPAPAHPTR